MGTYAASGGGDEGEYCLNCCPCTVESEQGFSVIRWLTVVFGCHFHVCLLPPSGLKVRFYELGNGNSLSPIAPDCIHPSISFYNFCVGCVFVFHFPIFPFCNFHICLLTVLFLTLKTFSATGGIEKFNRCFAKALWLNSLQQGWTVEVLSAYDNQPDEQYLPAAAFKSFKGKKKPFSIQALKSAAAADTIVVGHINLASIALAGQLLFPKKKWVLVAHGREVWEPLSMLQRKALAGFHHILSVSRFTSSQLMERQSVPSHKIGIFPNTLDPFFATQKNTVLPATLRKRYGLEEGQPILITVTRLANTEKNKGCDEVLKALPKVLGHYPNVRYLLCGKADIEEKNRLLLMISELNLQKVVILAGFIEDSELTAHYLLANVFVMPSRKEGFGIVFIEAAWWGLQVIAGNQDGSVDALLDGKLGKLINPTNQAALETAIVDSLRQPAMPTEKADNKKLLEANFGFDKFQERQRNVLLSVIAKAPHYNQSSLPTSHNEKPQ